MIRGSMAMALTPTLRSRLQGCLVGAVSGDCLGAPYEICGVPPKDTFGSLTTFFEQIGTEIKEKDYFRYTDDTAMCRCIAESLIENKGNLNSEDLAKKFGIEYTHAPNRGYGANVISVLKAFNKDLDDVFEPARMQFKGSGSYGNGGAMRVAPVALCPEADFDKMIEAARQSALLTHSNFNGYCGTILQCCAVHLALHSDPATFDTDAFIDRLLEVMEKEEAPGSPAAKVSRPNNDSTAGGTQSGEYCRRLRLFKPLLEEDADIKKVAAELGNEISAHKSVPAAIYSFLRCRTPVEGISSSNALERTILYAISLDGDTDTIASMAGAIAGAFYGVEPISADWRTMCEGTDVAIRQADAIYDIHFL
ncbi:ADP-ribose glycohydrolase ARH3 [Strongylocentrotus purpuratus]|uniref:ADP-ribosylhydrolase ARH3 n=1 Tax=Strongylocentrotus purpuratus TaxID=7668 RepID=A0A7M7NW39_STRPU|nr:ADP-ribose glycohydrolase ARH3 [Strongylocentrotus purpuratus]XP_030841603.1 ADP-ribose glycohydrolase ARH3 [Strongylocentrotus purpuratus]|eukprot:XP_011667658.1 PREDICTED: poly(ADP-ribose) glycohydrolase ARH3 [Strongylocentrotus purpuratus]